MSLRSWTLSAPNDLIGVILRVTGSTTVVDALRNSQIRSSVMITAKRMPKMPACLDGLSGKDFMKLCGQAAMERNPRKPSMANRISTRQRIRTIRKLTVLVSRNTSHEDKNTGFVIMHSTVPF